MIFALRYQRFWLKKRGYFTYFNATDFALATENTENSENSIIFNHGLTRINTDSSIVSNRGLTRIPAFAGADFTDLTDKNHNNSVFLSKNGEKCTFFDHSRWSWIYSHKIIDIPPKHVAALLLLSAKEYWQTNQPRPLVQKCVQQYIIPNQYLE